MDSSSRSLEIRIISGEALRLNRRHSVKKNAFVVIRTDSIKSESTKIDTEGGSYPIWDEKIVINMSNNLRNINIEVQCKTYSGNKSVGTAIIPVSDFVGGYIPTNYLHFLSYRLRDRQGERNGIINLSVRVKGNDDFAPHYLRQNAAALNDSFAPSYLNTGTVNGSYNGGRNNKVPENRNLRQCTGASVGGEVSSAVVTGVPIWHTYNV